MGRPKAKWLHEIKIDGYRAQAHVHEGQVRVYSRSGYDGTRQFHRIAKAADALSRRDVIIDGEAAVLGTDDEAGGTSLSPEVIAQARGVETSRPHQARPRSGLGSAWILVAFTASFGAGLIVWALISL